MHRNGTWGKRVFGAALALALALAGMVGVGLAQGTGRPAESGAPPSQQSQPLKDFFRYNPQGKIDPFKPFLDPDAAKQKAAMPKALPLNPLQRLSIDQFRLVGVVQRNGKIRAMVQDPAGRFYSLLQGAAIGLNEGRVAAILPDRVIVNEKIRTDEGKTHLRKHIMKLRQDEVTP
jgi:type IV pilus assembly protein PilP